MQRILGTLLPLPGNGARSADLSRRHLLDIAVLFGAANLLPAPLAASESPAPMQPMGLDDFMSLSEALTGAKGLSRELAELYLKYLTARPGGGQELTVLWNAAGLGRSASPQRRREPAQAGVFPDKNVDRTARTILKLWYTGRYEADGVPRLAEYTDTLAWRAVGYTVAPSNCGGRMGFWAEPPHDAEPRND